MQHDVIQYIICSFNMLSIVFYRQFINQKTLNEIIMYDQCVCFYISRFLKAFMSCERCQTLNYSHI